MVSLFGLLLLVFGVPAALVLVAPIGHFHVSVTVFQHPSRILQGLHRPLSDETFVAASLLLGWLVWAYFLLGVILEVVGRLRGRIPVHLLFTARLQTAVAAVVGASLSVVPAVRSSAPMRIQPPSMSVPHPLETSATRATESTTAFALAGLDTDVAGHPSVIDSELPAAGVQDVAESAATYTVRPGDTLWSIAERELGAPLRWREIAALNMGRPQADGTSLQDDHWILPGWVLLLPLGSAMPPPAPSPHLTQAVAAGVAPGPSASKATLPSAHHRHLPIAPIGAGVLGAGVVVMLDRMRRAQQRRRRPGRIIKLPGAQLADVERGLRVGSNVASLSTVDLALRLLGTATRPTAGPGSPLVALRVERERVEAEWVERVDLLFDPTRLVGPPPAPFELGGEPATWVLPAHWKERYGMDRLEVLQSQEGPCPAVVTMGYDASTTFLVNLEALGSLSIVGADAALVLEAVTVELATLPWADSVDVVVVGHPTPLKALERVRQLTTVASAVVEARRRIAGAEDLALASDASAADARWCTSDSAWDAMVVVCLPSAAEAEPEACRRLVELAGDGGAGMAALIGTAVPARWTALADGGPLTLTGPSGWSPHRELVAQPSVPGLLANVDGIVAVASDETEDTEAEKTSEVAVGIEPSVPLRAGGAPESDGTQMDGEIEVRVLGPVEVAGARPFTRAWALELVVYLVMHESGATTDQWSGALWPDRLMAPASLHSTASSARRALGMSSTGEDHLPRSHGRLALAKTVTSDWARFRRLAASEDPARLTEALRLIRGRPFLGLRSTDWVLLEGFMADIEGTVVDVACRVAEHALQNGDPAGAETAARMGLRVSEYDERLYRVLLRAADSAGNPAGVESTMLELVRLVADDVEPYDAVHPETLELYRQLSRRGGIRRGA
jgi:LysM repeat protein/DNA-binding SARP family transcriptional activator